MKACVDMRVVYPARHGWAAIVVILLIFAGSAGAEELSEPPLLVDHLWLVEHLDDPGVRVLDYRKTAIAYRLGHVTGASRIPRRAAYDTVDGVKGMLPSLDVLAEYLGEAGVLPEHRVVIYDESDGLWAARLFWALEVIGHERVHLLDGGYRTWRDQSGPVRRSAPSHDATSYTKTERPDLVAGTDWMLDQIGNPGVQIIDSRSPAEYDGEDRRAKRGGHMPGALNVDWVNNLTNGEGSSFLPPEPLQSVYSRGSIRRDLAIVAHCQTGVRAAHTYFVLRLLGYTDVRVYDGSWEVWGNRSDTPIVSAGE